MDSEIQKITSKIVPDNKRLDFLPKYAGNHFMKYESMIYGYMKRACESYDDGYWEFYTLSNGGFYMAMASDETLAVEWTGNYFEDTMSADAASIGVNLFVKMPWHGSTQTVRTSLPPTSTSYGILPYSIMKGQKLCVLQINQIPLRSKGRKRYT